MVRILIYSLIYLRILVVMAIPFGIGTWFYWWSFYNALYSGIAFGVLMSAILGTMHIKGLKKVTSKEIGFNALRVHQKKVIEIKKGYDEAYLHCLNSLRILDVEIEEENKAAGKITAKTSLTPDSFGEFINIMLTKINSEQTKINISSKPVVKVTLIDYGKNLQNIKKMTELLEQETLET